MAEALRIPAYQVTSMGVMLKEEFLEPFGMTQGGLAMAMGVNPKTVQELCGNRRRVTAATASLLAEALGTTPAFWLNLQRLSDGHGN